MAQAMREIEFEIDPDDFETDELIKELEYRGYTVLKGDCSTETIETDIRGAQIEANGGTYSFGGCVKIVVGRDA